MNGKERSRGQRFFAEMLYLAVEQHNMSHSWHNFICPALIELLLNSIFPVKFPVSSVIHNIPLQSGIFPENLEYLASLKVFKKNLFSHLNLVVKYFDCLITSSDGQKQCL